MGPVAVLSPLMTAHTAARLAVRSTMFGLVCATICAAHLGSVSRIAQSTAPCVIGRPGPVDIAMPWVTASFGTYDCRQSSVSALVVGRSVPPSAWPTRTNSP